MLGLWHLKIQCITPALRGLESRFDIPSTLGIAFSGGKLLLWAESISKERSSS
jgi:hypothetical protein